MWNVVPAVRWRVSTLPPPSCGGNGMKVPSRSGQLPMVPQNGHDRDLDARHERRRRAPAQVEGAHEAVGELLGQQAELGQDRAPAPLAGLEREDLDRERVARLRAFDAHRPREVVEGVEVELALLERRALVHLAVAGHEEVEVHDVARLDAQRGRELAIPGVVIDGRVEDVLGHAQSFLRQ